jgi:hypothetical protein
MQTTEKETTPDNKLVELGLHQIIDQLMGLFLPRAVCQKNFIVNNVHKEIYVDVDNLLLASVLGNLLYSIVAHTSDSSIEVSAKAYSNLTLIHIRKRDILFEEDIIKSIQPMHSLAQKLGGCITVTNNKIKGTTMAFTFLNIYGKRASPWSR